MALEQEQVRLGALREKAMRLRPDDALVGWFPRDAHYSGDTALRRRDAISVLLTRESSRWYKDAKQLMRPTLISAVPLIRYNNRTFVGGEWFRKGRGSALQYLTKMEPGAAPVGWLRDIFETKEKSTLRLKVERPCMDRRLIELAHGMLDWYFQDSTCGDLAVNVPRFIIPVPREGSQEILYLRDDGNDEPSELSACLQRCAYTGDWAPDNLVVGMLAPDRGTAHRKVDNPECLVFVSDDGIRDEFPDPSRQLEELVRRVFGQSLAVQLISELSPGKSYRVSKGQPLWAPLPRCRTTAEALRRRPDYAALRYLAALSTVEENFGTETIDDAVAYSSAETEPWVDLGSVPQISKVVYRPNAFQEKTASYEVDLYHTPLRLELQRRRRVAYYKERKSARSES